MFSLKDVREVAATLPQDAVNPAVCAYTYLATDDNGEPLGTVEHCIAGAIFKSLVPRLLDEINDVCFNEESIVQLRNHGLLGDFDEDAVEWLGDAQFKADNGRTWGESIKHADEKAQLAA